METILVTGAAGFIASHLVRYLMFNYVNVKIIALDKLTYCSSLCNLEDLIDSDRLVFEKVDLVDLDQVMNLFCKYKIDYVFHLAAFTHVDMSFKHPLIFTHNNVVGTHNLLDVARENKVKLFLHMSTDEVYGTSDGVSDKHSPLNPTNPYSASKAGAEFQVRAYHHCFKMPTIIVRCNNAYGTHQYPEKVVPLFVSLLSKGKKCTMHGSGKQTRSFIHVYDVCRALDLIWKKGELGEIYLIGSEDEISIVDLARKIAKCIESTKDLKEEDFIAYGEDRCSNDKHYHIDDKELRSLGFKQKIPFDEGLKDVVKWYLENPDYWESSRKESSS